MKLIITVTFTDPSDFDFARNKMVSAVENVADELEEEKRLDGTCEVDWEEGDE